MVEYRLAAPAAGIEKIESNNRYKKVMFLGASPEPVLKAGRGGEKHWRTFDFGKFRGEGNLHRSDLSKLKQTMGWTDDFDLETGWTDDFDLETGWTDDFDLDNGWTLRGDLRKNIPERGPEEYLSRFYYDRVSHSAPLLAYLIDQVGADRVMLGSNFFYGMGYDRPVEVVTQHPALDADQQALILGGNARRLLRLNG